MMTNPNEYMEISSYADTAQKELAAGNYFAAEQMFDTAAELAFQAGEMNRAKALRRKARAAVAHMTWLA